MARKIAQNPDCWGFNPVGGQESAAMYFMRTLEEGGKSKDTIRSEYMWDFKKPAGASNAQSTFNIFFGDVVQPFGHASQSRSLLILPDAQGHLSLDPSRAQMAKDAVKKGIMERIRDVPGEFPPDRSQTDHKDPREIEKIREEFRVPLKK